MNTALAGLFASVGLALVITASTLPGRQTAGVLDSLGTAGAHLEEASLGERV